MTISCIICDKQHDRLWFGSPALYCHACAELKNDGLGKVTHVFGNLYLGDAQAAQTFDGTTLCVHESKQYVSQYHIPILAEYPKDHFDRSGALVSMFQMWHASDFIAHHLLHGCDDILVHCAGGVERSPLTVAYFLANYQPQFLIDKGYLPTLPGAYSYLKSIRPVVSDRTSWLPRYQQQLLNLQHHVNGRDYERT